MKLLFLLFLFQVQPEFSENILSLDYLLDKAREQFEYSASTSDYRQLELVENQIIKAESLPLILLTANASYQTDVAQVQVPVPGFSPPQAPKTRFSMGLTLSQIVYDGGVSSLREKSSEINRKDMAFNLEQKWLRYQQSVTNLYFAHLLQSTQANLIDNSITVLRKKENDLRIGIEQGVVLARMIWPIQTEIIRLKKEASKAESEKQNYIIALNMLCGIEIQPTDSLQLPNNQSRPLIYESDYLGVRQLENAKSGLDLKLELYQNQYKPKIQLSAQAAVGKPGLNMFDESIQPYGIIGIEVRWRLWDWKARKLNQDLAKVNKQEILRSQMRYGEQIKVKQVSLLNEISQHFTSISLIDEAITIQQLILNDAEIQLTSGNLTMADFLAEKRKMDNLELSKKLESILIIKKQHDLMILEAL